MNTAIRINRAMICGTVIIVYAILSDTMALCAELTAAEIIQKSEQAMQGNTQAGVYRITIKTRRWTRTMEMKSFMNRVEKKNFSEIHSPKKDAGNRFLLLDKLMWHYVPKLQQTIKISPSMMLQSWMGSDFTNDDIVKESSILTDYTHTLEGMETIAGHECHRIRLDPRPDAAVVWGKIVYFARTGDHLPARQEYYNEHGEMKKFMTYDNYRRMDDRVIPTSLTMRSVKEEDRFTLMEITEVKFDLPIPDDVFSFQNLKRK